MKKDEIIDNLKLHYDNNYSHVEKNHWIFEIKTIHDRSQIVHLYYHEANLSDLNISRFIAISPIGPVFRRFEYDKVLRINCDLDVGAIGIKDLYSDDNIKVPYLVLRSTHLAVTIDFEELWELIDKTGSMADHLEEEIFAKDTH